MTCEEADGLLSVMAEDEEVTEELVQAYEEHLEQCTRCREAADRDEGEFFDRMDELFDPPERKRN